VNRFFITAILLAIFAFTAPSSAWSQSAEEGSVDQAIEQIGKTVWFDPETKSLTPVELEDKQSDTIHRDSRWLPSAKKIAKTSTSSTSGGSGSPGWFNTGITTGNVIGWLLLALLFILVTTALLYAFSKIDPNTLAGDKKLDRNRAASMDEQIINRIKELPAELRRTDVDLRTEAERLMELGEFDEAIKCLFGHQLLLLDRHGTIRLSRGKTNGRYVAETRRDLPEAAPLLQATVRTFEASYFGRHTPSRQAFGELWQANRNLEQLTKPELELAK
jgi:hypothetical protein